MVLVTLPVALVAVCGYAWVEASRSARQMHAGSAIASLSAGLRAYFDANSADPSAGIDPLAGDWRELTPAEIRQLIEKVDPDRMNIDGGPQGYQPDGTLLDPWGQPYRVSLRRDSDGAVLVSVASSGPDGVAGTADDIRRSDDDFPQPASRPQTAPAR